MQEQQQEQTGSFFQESSCSRFKNEKWAQRSYSVWITYWNILELLSWRWNLFGLVLWSPLQPTSAVDFQVAQSCPAWAARERLYHLKAVSLWLDPSPHKGCTWSCMSDPAVTQSSPHKPVVLSFSDWQEENGRSSPKPDGNSYWFRVLRRCWWPRVQRLVAEGIGQQKNEDEVINQRGRQMGHFKLLQSEQTKVNSTHPLQKTQESKHTYTRLPNSIFLDKIFQKYLVGLGQFHSKTDLSNSIGTPGWPQWKASHKEFESGLWKEVEQPDYYIWHNTWRINTSHISFR